MQERAVSSGMPQPSNMVLVDLDAYDSDVRALIAGAIKRAGGDRSGWPPELTDDLIALVVAAQALARQQLGAPCSVAPAAV